MVDEQINNNKTLTIVAVSFIAFLAYLAYKNRNMTLQPVGSLNSKNSNLTMEQLENEVHFLKEQLYLTQEKLEEMSQFQQYKVQENMKTLHLTSTRKLDDSKENKIRQQMFNMQ